MNPDFLARESAIGWAGQGVQVSGKHIRPQTGISYGLGSEASEQLFTNRLQRGEGHLRQATGMVNTKITVAIFTMVIGHCQLYTTMYMHILAILRMIVWRGLLR